MDSMKNTNETFIVHRPDFFTTNGWPNYITQEVEVGYRRLSDKSVLILLYLAGQNLENFNPSMKTIMKNAGIKSETSYSKYLKELKKCGYLQIDKWIDKKGRYQSKYTIYLDPLSNPEFDGEPPRHYFDRELYNQKKIQKKMNQKKKTFSKNNQPNNNQNNTTNTVANKKKNWIKNQKDIRGKVGQKFRTGGLIN